MGARDRDLPRTAAASLVACALLAAAAQPALAAEDRFDVHIPRQPRKQALLDFARQTGFSIGFPAALQCRGDGAAAGRLTAADALASLLRGSGCRAVRLDARTYAVEREPEPRPARASPLRILPQPEQAAEVDELLVTATKREASLSRAPYGLTALTGADLEAQDVRAIGDLPALAAGVTVTNLGPGRDKVFLRGLSDSALTGNTQSTVGIYLDELRLTYNAPDPDLPWIDVGQVEVLRGPQGSLYGSGSIGGVVHVVTNAPDPAARTAWLQAAGAATAEGDGSGSFEGVLNQPFGGGRGAVRLVGWWQDQGGYVDNLGTGQSDVDLVRRRGFRVAASWRFASNLTVTASLAQQTIDARDAHYAQPPGVFVRSVPISEPHGADLLAADVTLRWTPNWADVTLSSGVLGHDGGSRYDASLAPTALAPPGDRPRAYDDENDIGGVVNEARIVSRTPGRLQWLAGAFVAFGQQDLSGTLTGETGAVGYQEDRRDRLLETALFGEASYELGARWTLTAGARLFRSAVTTRSIVSQAGAQQRRFDGKLSDSGLAPKAVVAYQALDSLTLYVQAAEGYRAGGFNTSGPIGQLFGATPQDPQPLRRYSGDELWSFETGFRWRSPDRNVRLRGAAFYAVWRDIQSDLLLASGLPYTANIGDGRSTGVELEGSFARGPLTLSANLVAQQPELDRPDPNFPGRADARLPGVPKLSYALAASYERPIRGRWSLQLASRYNFVGASRLTFDAETAPHMGDYGDLHLSAALRSPSLRLEAFIDNATNDHGDTFAYGNPFSLRLIPQSTPQRPRTLGLAVTRAF